VNKPSGGHSFPVLRDGVKWMIDLEELKEMKIKKKTYLLLHCQYHKPSTASA